MIVSVVLSFAVGPLAGAADFQNATYSMAQGTVKVTAKTKDSFKFALDNFSVATINIFAPSRPEDAMPRLCSLEGAAVIKDSVTAIYETGKNNKDEYCYLTFTFNDALLTVTGPDCKLCDNTSPEGTYRLDDGKCAADKMKKQREEFNAAYKSKRYAESIKTMENLLDTCRINLSNPDISWLLNDLALARYKAGDKKGCLQAIEEIPMGLEGKLEKAVKFNKELCSKQ
jgi:hypothetical protein